MLHYFGVRWEKNTHTCMHVRAHKDTGLYVEDSELTMNDVWTTVNRHHNIPYDY